MDNIEEYGKINKNDFVLKIYKGSATYNSTPTIIDVYSIDAMTLSEYNISIDGNKKSIIGNKFVERLKKIIINNLEELVKYSFVQTKEYINYNSYDGGGAWNIILKHGNLYLNIKGQISENSDFCYTFIDKIIDLINRCA